ncbi:MAG: chorismate synthase [Candidatus Thermoplasmatota archaeon]|nr:chorismate synthase [Candidatus Thermoplasmatota archaeon]MCL5253588.1 chorismate synthase [Candidatus Thermoplasmatota archaeon]
MNTIGRSLMLTIFGESHGEMVGAVLDGLPSGTVIDTARIMAEMELRKPAPLIGTARTEPDDVRISGGLRDGVLTGTPLVFLIYNRDIRSASYAETPFVPRPGHADYTAHVKYSGYSDFRGGGQFSGRLTAPIVAAGAAARQFLSTAGIRVAGHVVSIGNAEDSTAYDFEQVERNRFSNEIRCIDSTLAEKMRTEILEARKDGDSVGGIVECICTGIPAGVGEPFFDSVEGELSKFIFSIPAVKGIEFGSGFRGTKLRGSLNNDQFVISGSERKVVTETNNSGGINGGITNGMPVVLRVAFKPTSSIPRKQKSIDLRRMEETELVVKGRHDPCIVPRAVIVVEAVCCLTIADLYLRSGLNCRKKN